MNLNQEQKQWLAKMLPGIISIQKTVIGDFLTWNGSTLVKPTEELHLVGLVEKLIPCNKTLDYQELLVRATCNPEKSALHPENYEWHAHASQRCTALMEVMK